MLKVCLVSSSSCLLSTGAPDSLVHHRTLSGADFFPVLAQPTVGDLEPLAHQTVRCPLQTVGPATRHARIARPTVGSPDSPVNFSHTPPTISRGRPFHQSQPGAPDTVRCTQTEQSLGCSSQVFSNCIFSDSST
jgi:hypothetical protein